MGVIYDSDGSPWLPEQRTDSAYKSIVPAAKVLSETFSINRNVPYQSLNTRRANPYLINPFMRDETRWYLNPSQRKPFKIALSGLAGISNGDTVYIALSSKMDWIPVGMGVAKNDTVDFGYVGNRTVCVAGVVHSYQLPKRVFFVKIFSNSLFFLGGKKRTSLLSRLSLMS